MSACSARVKTCQTCATAKIRCLRSPGAAICDRCARLNKPCYFRPARLRQAWPKKETRLESLERRLDQLLNQGQSPQSNTSPGEKTGDVIDKGIVTLDDAAALLDSFLQFLMPHFPFVVLPSQATAGDLRDQKPFLFLAILSVAVTDDRALKRSLDEEFKAALAERAVLGNQPPSLETLQGLLVVLAWCQHQAQQRSGPRDFMTYLHLAIGLVVDLELDRPPEMHRRCRRMSIQEIGTEVRPVNLHRAEQRAAIGCSFLSSCSGIITQKKCIFPWTAHLEAFAVELAQKPEYTSDQSIIHLVRLQHVFEEMDQVSMDPDFLEIDKGGRAFQHMFRTFKAQLQEFSNKLPPHWRTNNFLLAAQLHTVNLYLCQVSLFDRKTVSELPVDFRSEILCHGLDAAKACLDSLVSIPVGTERCFSYTQWLETGFDLILSCKLVLMAVSDESLRHSHPHIQSLCDALDMPGVLKTCINRQLSYHSGPRSKSTGFDYTGWLQWIQGWFLRHYDEYLAHQRAEAVTKTSTISANYVAPAVHVGVENINNGGLGFSEEMLSWPSFAEMCMTDNPLASWMDLNLMPM
ncbi:hypothetical protein BDV06DRAFT_199520 [Aspergillus oleicola]